MATKLSPQTDVVRDDQGIVRRISHARAPYVPAGFTPASPTSLANWYLQQFGSFFGLDPGWLAAARRVLDALGITAVSPAGNISPVGASLPI